MRYNLFIFLARSKYLFIFLLYVVNRSGKIHLTAIGTARFLVNLFICPYMDDYQGCNFYWNGGNFKVPHFLKNSGTCICLFYCILWLICYYPLALAYKLDGMFLF